MKDVLLRYPPVYHEESTEVPTGDIERDALRLIVMCRVWDKGLRAAIWHVDEIVRAQKVLEKLVSEQGEPRR